MGGVGHQVLVPTKGVGEMTLDKAIEHGQEHRKPYYGAKAADPSCRNHGDDDWALRNRTYQRVKAEHAANSQIKEWFSNKEKGN